MLHFHHFQLCFRSEQQEISIIVHTRSKSGLELSLWWYSERKLQITVAVGSFFSDEDPKKNSKFVKYQVAMKLMLASSKLQASLILCCCCCDLTGSNLCFPLSHFILSYRSQCATVGRVRIAAATGMKRWCGGNTGHVAKSDRSGLCRGTLMMLMWIILSSSLSLMVDGQMKISPETWVTLGLENPESDFISQWNQTVPENPYSTCWHSTASII